MNHICKRSLFSPIRIGSLLASIFALTNLNPQISFASLSNSKENLTQDSISDETQILQLDSYIIGPGDLLHLVIFDAPDLSGKLKVLNDGSVGLPLIGSKVLSGMTIAQATSFIKNELSNELIRTDLQLKVDVPRAILVSLVGEIKRPGIYSLSNEGNPSLVQGSGEQSTGLPTVINAIQTAGGITQKANLRNVQLQRRLPGKASKYKTTKLDLLSLILEGDQIQNPYLFDGDIIKLTPAKQLSESEISLASANLSPQTISVNIIGEVVNPGPVIVKANTPLSQAVLAAGGPTNWRSNQGNVDLVRINRNGSATLNQFKIDLSQEVSAENPPLKDGDVIRVRRNAYAKTNDAIKSVSEPLTGLVTLYSLFRLMN